MMSFKDLDNFKVLCWAVMGFINGIVSAVYFQTKLVQEIQTKEWIGDINNHKHLGELSP